MFKNYFIIAWRNLVRNRSFSLINIGGLSFGLAASLLLFMIISYELSYNKFLPDHENVYQIVTQNEDGNSISYTPGVPYPALEAFRTALPEAIIAPLVSSQGSQITVTNTDGTIDPSRKFSENGVFYADADLFSILQFEWISGNPAVLAEPNTAVLTKAIAEKYFGSWEKALEQSILIDNTLTVKIKGILKDLPYNSDFPLEVVTSYITFKTTDHIFGYNESWGNNSSSNHLYIKISASEKPSAVSAALNNITRPHYDEIDNHSKRHHLMLPLGEIHYDTRFSGFGAYLISKKMLTMLSMIGTFILVMACINFINLSTAQAINRSKEIGIRKVLGSKKNNIFWQLMSETALLVLLSSLIAIGIVQLALPYVKYLTSIENTLPLFTSGNLLFLLITGTIVTFMAGSYPSLVIAGFNPTHALKSKQRGGKTSLRRALVVLQFTISQVLIIGTIIAILQMNNIRNADLGFNKEAVYVLQTSTDQQVLSKQPAFKQELLKINGVEHVSENSDVPSSDNNSSTNFAFNRQPDEKFALFIKSGDEDYFSTYDIEFVAGKPYTQRDSLRSVVVNETLVKMLGQSSPEEILGKEIRLGSGNWRTIVGVMKDFPTNSLREATKPLLVAPLPGRYYNIAIKMNSNNLQQVKSSVNDLWNQIFPEYVLSDFWVDERIANFYKQEDQVTLLYKVFSGIAIFIACLGLYGLISFTTIQKRKEVGIRKVLGASVANILYLFSKEITLLIILALAISIPVSWMIAKEWLDNFAHKISVHWGIFAVAAITSVLIAWLTISVKSVSAATTNPVKNLRDE